LQATILLGENGFNLEIIDIARSGLESVDLVFLFSQKKNEELLTRWFEGATIKNELAGREFDRFMSEGMEPGELIDFAKMKADIYGIYSKYSHS
jgi:hypothetical protein